MTCVTVLYAPSLDLSPVGSSTHVAATAMQGRPGMEMKKAKRPGLARPPQKLLSLPCTGHRTRDLQLPFSAGTDDARDDGSQVHACMACVCLLSSFELSLGTDACSSVRRAALSQTVWFN